MKITLIGRPNTGKSTLFNRIYQQSRIKAQVSQTSGYTRDRKEILTDLDDIRIQITDTAGLDECSKNDGIITKMQQQTHQAIENSDLCLFLVDGIAGITPYDRHFAKILKQKNAPVKVVVNKVESKKFIYETIYEASKLGFGKSIQISAQHSIGIDELYLMIKTFYKKHSLNNYIDEQTVTESEKIYAAIVGRPNAGKSSLINVILKQERMITSHEPGTTRDAIIAKIPDENIFLYDTAGIRKKAQVKLFDEKIIVKDAIKAIDNSDVVALLMQYSNALETQDLVIANIVEKKGKPLIFVISKCDEIKNQSEMKKIIAEKIQRSLPEWSGTKILFTSAHKNQGIQKLIEQIISLKQKSAMRITTAKLNQWLKQTIYNNPPPREVKIRYITQIEQNPPLFNFFLSRPEKIPQSYKRYISNQIRESFKMYGIPIKTKFTKIKNPYDKK